MVTHWFGVLSFSFWDVLMEFGRYLDICLSLWLFLLFVCLYCICHVVC